MMDDNANVEQPCQYVGDGGDERIHTVFARGADAEQYLRARKKSQDRIAELEDALGYVRREMTTLQAQMHDAGRLHQKYVKDAEARHDVDGQRIGEVLRHNTELVEEKRLLTVKLQDTIARYDAALAVWIEKAVAPVAAAAAMPTLPSLPSNAPLQWVVRHATDDAALETLLNLLSESGWMIDQINESRTGGYRVIAWRQCNQEHGNG